MQSKQKIEYIKGDICKTKALWIVHQCNCTSITSKGLSASIFSVFPYANTYKSGSIKTPGTISIHGYDSPSESKGIINLYAQYWPSKPMEKGLDTIENREKWFIKGLNTLQTYNKYDHIYYGSFAFPKNIGCGYGGGDWNKYLKHIENFTASITGKVYIYSPSSRLKNVK